MVEPAYLTAPGACPASELLVMEDNKFYYSLNQWFKDFRVVLNHREGSLNADCRSYPQSSGSVSLGLGLRIWISSKFTGDPDAAGPGATLGKLLE